MNRISLLLGLFSLTFATVAVPINASARLLQIIYTNDLHSFLEKADDKMGGYAQIKATIDRMKADAKAQGIDTLTLDGGDFSEGSEFFFADRGQYAWKAMNAMGYDAVVMGNHDWLTGLQEVDNMLGVIKPKFALVGANIYFVKPKLPNMDRHLRSWVEFEKSGYKIGVLGLTTDDFVFNWAADEGKIVSPIKRAKAVLPTMRKRNHFVFVLSHMGFSTDLKLARTTTGVDMVLGAHSHDHLPDPVMAGNKKGIPVPILQTGSHGVFVGDCLVDLVDGQPVKVVRHQLVPIFQSGPKDEQQTLIAQEARKSLEDEYGYNWLYEPIAEAKVPLEKQRGPTTVWSRLVADAMREAGHADLSLDIPAFSGVSQPAGPITREQLMLLYPRIMESSRRYGWTVWTAKAPGWALQILIKEAAEKGYPLTMSNVSYNLAYKNGKMHASKIRIGGKRINIFKNYRLAIPEGIGRAILEINWAKFLYLIIQKTKDTGQPVWFAVEDKMKRMGGVIE